MSYDIEIHELNRHGTSTVAWERNMTSNIAPMLRLCDFKLLSLDGISVPHALAAIECVLERFVNEKSTVIQAEPENKWGTYPQCLLFLHEVKCALEQQAKDSERSHRDAVVLVYS